MKLPRKELLKGVKPLKGIDPLLDQAEKALKTWEAIWSPFISASLREKALEIMSPLNEIQWRSDGGHPGAERRRMQCIHFHEQIPLPKDNAPVKGLHIEGNFLFDPATPKEIRQSLENIGVSSGELGDIWMRNDRGAQAICTPEAATFLDGAVSWIRQVKITCESVEFDQLQLPPQRLSKEINTVEASPRIDAIASAGFGLSRSKVSNHIKQGRIRLNWEPIHKGNRELAIGDRIHHEDRGQLEVLNLELTKRNRWRVKLLKS